MFVFFGILIGNLFGAPHCRLTLPLFDEIGRPIDKTVLEIRGEGRNENLIGPPHSIFSIRGGEIIFPAKVIGRTINVVMMSAKGKVYKWVVVMACIQRTSLQTGQSDAGPDVSWSRASGVFSGCALHGDVWVRMVPMFDSHKGLNHEGVVEGRTGQFSITSNFSGERHILILGRGKDPIAVFGVNLTVGRDNPLGEFKLNRPCP
jgi:hypothetical protein